MKMWSPHHRHHPDDQSIEQNSGSSSKSEEQTFNFSSVSSEKSDQPRELSRIPQPLPDDAFATPRQLRDIIQTTSPSLEDAGGVHISDVSRSPTPEEKYPISPIPKEDGVVDTCNASSEVVQISDDEESVVTINTSSVEQNPSSMLTDNRETVTDDVYREQCQKVQKLQSDIQVINNTLRTVKLNLLEDGGQSIRVRRASLEQKLLKEARTLSNMEINRQSGDVPTIEDLEMKINLVLPRTFGQKAMSTFNAQKALTIDGLNELHGSLKTCPTEKDLAEDPEGLKVDLMLHQRRALAWLMWREEQRPSGGILADDMGLGKTLTMIALTMKSLENIHDEEDRGAKEDSQSGAKWKGGTLVVCPASLINQWSGEIDRRTRRGKLSYEVHHGPNRDTKAKRLAKHDIVITTYAIVKNESEKEGALFNIKWKRVVLDEAHQIRNYKCQTSEAACRLAAKSRWALTGTPIHNKELDMYALLKFLRCSPFDDLQVWKRWVGMKDRGGEERLHTVISSIMLRRTKAELVEKGMMNALPERTWELIEVILSKKEMAVYQRILVFSKTLFAQFLYQHAEKKDDYRLAESLKSQEGPNAEFFKMRQKLLGLNRGEEVKQSIILVLLLRLRQICCHPSLIKNMLGGNVGELDGGDGGDEELDLLEQLNNLNLTEENSIHDKSSNENNDPTKTDFNKVASSLLNPSNPVFSPSSISSKIVSLMDVLKNKISLQDDKVVIVSQWSSYLEIIEVFLKRDGYRFERLDGGVPVHKRMEIVNNFNNPSNKIRILMLSLTAGGVGLNLVGANHLFLLDLHWNPQLENQAQDRIYRVGQQKPVFIYKFMAADTIEKRILELQQNKLGIADNMLTGSKQVAANKLTIQDLRKLFEM
ncbi:unnamed protein product [Acanthoscelides obtectus]|uniref:Transcription termination factor 2 n=1 Tax=Acanthoscelides obtectus TaxID=200917 RepID=A0A9P0JP06_ACAOB|nr:unnamed protein product [Acanthoscelides obtectus]CAK1673595.1 Transcription termination factor 2 [Acanthoscelides obtectus]